jgi:hypothetical protein
MRLPPSEHLSRPWRIHELAPDFRVEDVWALPTPGGPDDFPRLVDLFASLDVATLPSLPVRTLVAAREALGGAFGWDAPRTGIGSRVHSLRDRMADDEPDTRRGPDVRALPFSPLYLRDHEWAAEAANDTMHGIVHLGWVPDGAGGWRGQLAILVKPNGVMGELYMAAIKPFRYALVYPTLLRAIGRAWNGDDYRDTFDAHIDPADTRHAEDLFRDALEHAPWPLPQTVGFVHRRGGGGRPAPPPTPHHVFGWRIMTSDPDEMRLEADSPLLHATLTGARVAPDRVALTTSLRYHRPALARAAWSAVGPIHRRVAPYLLARAARARVPESMENPPRTTFSR